MTDVFSQADLMAAAGAIGAGVVGVVFTTYGLLVGLAFLRAGARGSAGDDLD